MDTSKEKKTAVQLLPDQIKLKPVQAERLASVAGVSAKALSGLTVADISQKFRFQIDPTLLLFRKICGKVVKKDPVTGIEFPVPYATVHVEDTDCSLLGYFPASSKYSWYFPFRCRREVIGTLKTDECGNFCVWIPRWDIDWILKFRHERYCFPIIFERPWLRDILEEFVPPRIPPRPGPDPAPFQLTDRAAFIRRIEDSLGGDIARAVDKSASSVRLGASTENLSSVMDTAVLDQRIPPPLPKELRVDGQAGGKVTRSTLAALVKVQIEDFKELDLRAYIGPFKRCIDVLVPEWVPMIDIPDITFRVTQDTNGDGTEEVIYSEGLFQVRWDAGAIGPIKILANPNALAGLTCGGDPVPCGNVPAIVLAGRMPVANVPTIYDPVNGYALRPNRPHPSGNIIDPLPNPAAATPFHGAISLLGCTKVSGGATHYRVQYKYSADNGATFTSYTPFVGLTWPLFRLDGGGNPDWHYPTADADGWYPIALPPGPNPFLPQDLVLDWPTYAKANGRYVLKLELGTGGVVSSTSAEVAFNVDNSSPSGPLTVEWRKAGSGAFQQLVAPCPVVRRGATPVDVEFRVTLDASAAHLRSAILSAGGCGGGNFVFVSGNTDHWHTSAADNSVVLQAIYRLPAATLEGTYAFSGHVSGRAMNPNGGDGGHLILPDPWEYDPDDSHIYPNFAFSVINTD